MFYVEESIFNIILQSSNQTWCLLFKILYRASREILLFVLKICFIFYSTRYTLQMNCLIKKMGDFTFDVNVLDDLKRYNNKKLEQELNDVFYEHFQCFLFLCFSCACSCLSVCWAISEHCIEYFACSMLVHKIRWHNDKSK